METNLELTETLKGLIERNFRLITPANKKNTSFNLEIRVTGYNDIMHYMAHLIKVCIMALEAQESFSSPYIPEPSINISSVMELLLNMIPYEETGILDILHYQYLHDKAQSQKIPPKHLKYFLTPPSA